MYGILAEFSTTCIRSLTMMKKKGYKAGGMKKKGYAKGKTVKPDFLDIDNDGDTTESMKAASGKKAGGMMKKKGYARGKMVKGAAKGGMMKKKGMANGGKVRGAGIAKKGVRPAKMR